MSEWLPMESAPRDGTVVNVVGRYPDATAGYPRYAGFRDGNWWEYSRHWPECIVCWAWRPRDYWPQENEKVEGGTTAAEDPALVHRHLQAHEEKPASSEGELK